MRVIAYTRVSTSEQADSGLGLAAQKTAIEREITRRDWTNVEWIEDAGYSAKSLKRPGLSRALGALSRGDVLIVSKMDRLSRSVLDFSGLLQRAQREGWALVALDSPADLTTPQGEAMASVMVVFGQLERRLIGERTSAAMQAAKARGTRLGRPRLLSAPILARMAEERSHGASYRVIAERLNVEGVPTAQGGAQWYAATVRKVLQAS